MKKIKIGVIGLGYVGLPLAVCLSKKFEVKGFDINKNRIDNLCKGYDQTLEFTKKVDFKDLSARKHYAGLHYFILKVNGIPVERIEFELT